MPTSIPSIAVMRRRRGLFLVGLIALYAACALAVIDGIARGVPTITDITAVQSNPGL